jgi:hypothetical protein
MLRKDAYIKQVEKSISKAVQAIYTDIKSKEID